ncbi:hypothetical protein AOLI_G00190950 [Acnodon oligacanthus]
MSRTQFAQLQSLSSLRPVDWLVVFRLFNLKAKPDLSELLPINVGQPPVGPGGASRQSWKPSSSSNVSSDEVEENWQPGPMGRGCAAVTQVWEGREAEQRDEGSNKSE